MTQANKLQKSWRDMSLNQWLVTLAVLAILIGAPYGSYTYLKKGFNYRMESLQQLKPKDVDAVLVQEIEAKAPFANNSRLVHLPGTQSEKELALLYSIDDQIVDRDRFDIISFDQGEADREKAQIQFLNTPLLTQTDYNFMLIDTSNVIRGIYMYHDDLGKELIRHLAVVIPVPKRKEIKLNRDYNSEK